MTLPLLLYGLLACAPDPLPLPAEPAARAVDEARAEDPGALARALYEAPVAPGPTAREQRVRLLIWLLRLELDRSQLDRLESLRRSVAEQEARIAEAERQAVAAAQPESDRIFDGLWAGLAAGKRADDPELLALAADLGALSAGGARERGLLTLRQEGLRLTLDAERALLDTLSEAQEQRLAEGIFALRRQLDPVGTPGDWDTLVGPGYEASAGALMLRGTSRDLSNPLDLGALWSDAIPGERGLPEARREAILLMVLRQPGLDEAIAAASALAPR